MNRLTVRPADDPTGRQYSWALCHERLSSIEDILGDSYDLERLRQIVEASKLIGREVWAESRTLHMFRTKPRDIERTTIQYVSLLKDGTILCHTQTCAFPIGEVGRSVFRTKDAAIKAFNE